MGNQSSWAFAAVVELHEQWAVDLRACLKTGPGPRSPGRPKCPSAPGRPWIGPSVFRDVDRRAQPAVRQRLVVESWNDVHMGMQASALVPAQQVAVWGQQIVQRHLCLEQ